MSCITRVFIIRVPQFTSYIKSLIYGNTVPAGVTPSELQTLTQVANPLVFRRGRTIMQIKLNKLNA